MKETSNIFSNAPALPGPSIQRQLGQADLTFKELVHALPVAIYTCDSEGFIDFFNPAAMALWGRKPEIGKDKWHSFWNYCHADGSAMPLDECPVAITLKSGQIFSAKESKIKKNDHPCSKLLVSPCPIFNEHHHIIGVHNTVVDVTMQKQDEEKKAMLSALVES